MENSANGSTVIKEVKSQHFETKSEIRDESKVYAKGVIEAPQQGNTEPAISDAEGISAKKTVNRQKNRFCNKTPNPDLFMIYIYDLKSRKVISEFADLDNCSVGQGSIYNELTGQINKIYSSNYEADSITPIASIYPNMSWAFQVNGLDWAIISMLNSFVRREN